MFLDKMATLPVTCINRSRLVEAEEKRLTLVFGHDEDNDLTQYVSLTLLLNGKYFPSHLYTLIMDPQSPLKLPQPSTCKFRNNLIGTIYVSPLEFHSTKLQISRLLSKSHMSFRLLCTGEQDTSTKEHQATEAVRDAPEPDGEKDVFLAPHWYPLSSRIRRAAGKMSDICCEKGCSMKELIQFCQMLLSTCQMIKHTLKTF